MIERSRITIGLRACTLGVCLSLLAGCGAEGEAAASAAPAAAPQTTAPLAPTSVVATPGNVQASLTWSATTGATSYNVKRSVASGGPYVQIANVASTSYTDATVNNGTTYYYVVTAVSAGGESASSAQITVTLSPASAVPSVPVGLAAAAGNAQVTLTWSEATGANSYYVKRAIVSGGAYLQVGAPTSSPYTDSTVANGTTYYYVVSAVNSVGESTNSAQVSAIPAVPPSAPTSFGNWANVTPSNANPTASLSCVNYGAESVQVDPAHPSNLYAQFHCQGIWRSTDYGATWTGPINTGANGSTAGDCAGGITIPPNSTTTAPTIYQSCIRGNALGFWRSRDGGVNWTRYAVAPSGSARQDYYPPVVDPYDQDHLLMAGHEMNFLVESIDGGQNWTNVSVASGMLQSGGTGEIFFVNTGGASGTRGTWLWMAQQTGGLIGTWRTSNSGGSWVQVDKNEHPHGSGQIYQPDNNGVIFISGAYSDLGWGVLRSINYGQTWTHVGLTVNEGVVFGTSKNVYAMAGSPVGAGGTVNSNLQVGAQPGTGTWVAPGTPAGLTQGPAQVRVVYDGSHYILVGAMFNSGLWRYIEP